MKQKLQTLFITLLICLLGGVNLSSANAAGVSIPQELGSFINLSTAGSALQCPGCKVDTKESYNGQVIGSIKGTSPYATLSLTNSTQQDMVLVFKTGTKNGIYSPKVTVTLAQSETTLLSKEIKIVNTGGYDPKTEHVIVLKDVPEGDLTLKFSFSNNNARQYVCNLGYIALYPKADSFEAVVGQTGFATIGFPYATTLPAGVTGYAVTGVTSTAVTLTEVPSGTNIAANTGLIIVAKQGSYTFPVVESGTEIENNKLVANTEGVKTATTEGDFYVLAVTNEQTKTVGLAKIAQNGTLANNRAYMPASVIPANVSAQPATFRLVFGDATMVTEVGDGDAEAVETVVYNLAGQRVNDNAKGLVVVKGRVYLKK